MKTQPASRQFTIKQRLLIIIGIFNVLMALIVASRIYTAWTSHAQAQKLQIASTVIDKFYNVNRDLSLERATSLVILNASDELKKSLTIQLESNRAATDNQLQEALSYLQNEERYLDNDIASIKQEYQGLLKHRELIDKEISRPIEERRFTTAESYFRVSQSLMNQIQDFILIYSGYYQDISPMINQQASFKYFVWTLAENTGMEYAIIGQLIANNQLPTAEQRNRLNVLSAQINYDWKSLQKLSLSNDLARKLNMYVDEAYTHYTFTFEQVSQLLVDTEAVTPNYLITTEMWLGLSSQVVESLLVLQDEILKETQANLLEIKGIAKKRIVFSITIFICAIMLSIYCWRVVVLRISRPINNMVDALYNASMDQELESADLNHQDEIEKLSIVLEAFKNKANKIRQSNEELERFAFIAAHDLKTPLRAVESLSEWLEEDLAENIPPKSKQHLNEMRSRIRLMDRLLDDTLEYARIDTKMNPKTNELVIGTLLVDDIVSLLNPPAGFTIKVDKRLSEILLLRFPVQQVLYNLMRNALVHHDKPTGVIEISIEETDKHYQFCISDDGPGIDSRYHQKIFEMFQTLQPYDKNKGRGIGLAIVRKIITSSGEQISLKSAPGQGAQFCFTWPKPTISDLLKYKTK